MVTVVSKLLLLITLLGSFDHAASKRGNNNRQLSFRHPFAESNDIEETSHEEVGIVYTYKSGKGSKSGGKSGGKGMKSEKKQYVDSAIGKGKGVKSDKSTKALHAADGYEVQYEVVVGEHYGSKSSKNRPVIPDFEYTEIGHRSSKSAKYAGKGYDGNAVAKTGKSSKYSDGEYYGNTVTKTGKSSSKYSDGGYYGNNVSKNGKSDKSGHKTSKSTTLPAPTIRPAPTLSPRPTVVDSFGVDVPQYSLSYTFSSNNEATAEEVDQLEEATRSYLSDFFYDEFDEDDFTTFVQFITDIISYSAPKNMPVVIHYNSIGRFDEVSTVITPTPTQLGSAVEEAFTGLHLTQYEDWLKEKLPAENIFVGSKIQFYQGNLIPYTSRHRIGVMTIAASAVAFTLLMAGAVLCKSKSGGSRISDDKLTKSHGDGTVAGETFAGETYDGTSSVSATSMSYGRRGRDEEEGTKSISESRDTDSMQPTWSDDGEDNENGNKSSIFRRGISPKKIMNTLRGSIASAQNRNSLEDAALQAPTSEAGYGNDIMADPSSSDDEGSQMSESELSQFVASKKQMGHTLEIKSLLSQDSIDDNASGDLSVRDNSSRRLRTVAEIEALLSSELKDEKKTAVSSTQPQHEATRPRTVEEIESLLTEDEDDDDSYVELPCSDEDESIDEC